MSEDEVGEVTSRIHCRICGCPFSDERIVACTSCGAPHHADCWEFLGSCAVYGCGGRSSRVWDPAEVRERAMVIDESTTPPMRIAPYIESVVRRIPAPLRTIALCIVAGAATGFLVFSAAHLLFYFTIQPSAFLALATICTFISFVTSHLDPIIRRRPWVVGGLSSVVVILVMQLPEPVSYGALMVTASLFLCALVTTSLSIVQGLTGSSRGEQNLSPWRRMVRRVTFTLAVLIALFIAIGYAAEALAAGMFRLHNWQEFVVATMMGIAVAAPPTAMASSPLIHRLKKEAWARDDSDEMPPIA